MKLHTELRYKVEEQLGAEAIPDEHPVAPELKEIFGDHTFFLDQEGLNIVVPRPTAETESGNLVKVASWTESRQELQVHDPQVLPVVVDITDDGPEDDTAA